jgi:phytoene/squalene synthetase
MKPVQVPRQLVFSISMKELIDIEAVGAVQECIRRFTSTYTIHLAELRAWQSMEQHRVGTLTWGHQPAMGVFG